MTRRMHTYYLDDELTEGLRAVHERDGILSSEQVRRAIRRWLEWKGYRFPTPRRTKKGAKKK